MSIKYVYQKAEKLFDIHHNFPKAGVTFRSMKSFLASTEKEKVYDALASEFKKIDEIDDDVFYVAGIDSRGYIVATELASRLTSPQILIAKGGKLPGETHDMSCSKEYGSSDLEINTDVCEPDDKVIICDDLLATGGSALAAAKLIEACKGKVAGFCFLGVLPECDGIKAIEKTYPGIPIMAACCFNPVVDPNPSLTKYLVNYRKVDVFDCKNELSKNKTVLLAHPTMYSWVKLLMNLYPTNFSYIHVKWDHFNDGTQDIFFPYAEKLRDHDVVFLMSNYDQSKLIDQWMLERVLPRQKVNSLQIWLPYFSTATHERVTKPGVVAAAEPMWKLLSSGMPKTKTGPAELINVDIHAQQEQFYGTDDLTYTFLDGVPRFLQLIDLENTTIIFPDNGSCKRFKTAIDKYKIPTLVFEKQRLGDERKVSFSASYHFPTDLKEKEKCMRYGIIVDDLALSGSTLIETAKALKEEMKFEFISCYITHACFPLKAYNKFKKRFDPFTTVYCTDSIPDTQEQILKLTNSPFYILPLAPLFSNYINKEDNQRPKLRIASTNKSKISAVSEAFNFVFQFGYYSVSEDNSSSNVNPQPIGDETLIGAKYRIYNLSANIYKAIEINRYDRDFDINDYRYKYFFSIENGLFQEEGKWYDKAVIIIEDTENKTEWIGYSDPTPIPTKYVEASRATNFMKTAGEFIHEEFPEYDAGDWFLKFGPKSRKQVLKETIIKGLYQLLCS